ncbi:hypothetical protein K427_14680 [Escherichia coli MP1]|nr:hypothetical protein K427_14680 [Escherichia coli MP1]RBX88086.1 hypothetical protein DS998_04525 [Escherichia coli]BDY96222.1 hypothetical protein MUTS15_48790 [Escherichia coli]
MTSVDVDILIAYSSKVAPDSLLFTADGRHIDSWGGIKKPYNNCRNYFIQLIDVVFYSFL